jgi:O-antigen ligase
VTARTTWNGEVVLSGDYPGAEPWTLPRSAAPSRVNLLVRLALYLFVLSIPFELPKRSIPLEVPTLTGFVLLGATLLNPSACFRRIPAALLFFTAYLWVLGVSGMVNEVEYRMQAVRLFISLGQLVLLFWVVFNLLEDQRVLRGTLLALVASCVARAVIQLLGIGATPQEVWTGGARLTVLGQNANLSAIILSAGLVMVIGLRMSGDRRLPRLGAMAWPLALLISWAVIQTGSRGGLLCAAAGVATFTFRGRTAWLKLRNGALAVLGLGLLGWGALRSPMMRARLEEAAVTGHLAGRERIYPAALQLVRERPILGWGPVDNQYEIARRIEERRRLRRDAHNLVLELLTTAGLAGAMPFMCGLALCVRGGWRARRGPLGVLPMALLAAVLTGTMSGTWIAAKILWLALAVALAAGTHWVDGRSLAPAGHR